MACVSAVAAAIAVGLVACAASEPSALSLEVIDQPVKVGSESRFTVQLFDSTTGQPVRDAMIVSGRLRTAEWFTKVPARPRRPINTQPLVRNGRLIGSPGPGLYQLSSDIPVPGTWTLRLAVTVPGESQTLVGKAKLQAR